MLSTEFCLETFFASSRNSDRENDVGVRGLLLSDWRFFFSGETDRDVHWDLEADLGVATSTKAVDFPSGSFFFLADNRHGDKEPDEGPRARPRALFAFFFFLCGEGEAGDSTRSENSCFMGSVNACKGTGATTHIVDVRAASAGHDDSQVPILQARRSTTPPL
mmetsp:Transcript_87953/g.145513  ORF Transcript_87953/g.145513 Transcript_87953/m.145513 type:complete len:163 (+) Transcript_87953:247-735(+)